MPKVSIVVPVFNGLPYLRDTTDSLRSQKFQDFELLFLDDGSTDGSAAYLEQIADSRVRVIHQNNSGLCTSMNRLIDESRSPLIMRSDQDDSSRPDRLEKQVALIERDGWDFLFCQTGKIGRTRRWSNRDKETPSSGTTRALCGFAEGAKLHSTLLARKGPYQDLKYRSEFYPSDDFDLQLRAEERYRVGILLEPLVDYRFHENASTKGRFLLMQDKVRWTLTCASARRRGDQEPTFCDFSQFQKSQAAWRRINRMRNDACGWAQRSGGEAWLNGRNFHAMAFFCVAAVLGPARLTRRMLMAWRGPSG